MHPCAAHAYDQFVKIPTLPTVFLKRALQEHSRGNSRHRAESSAESRHWCWHRPSRTARCVCSRSRCRIPIYHTPHNAELIADLRLLERSRLAWQCRIPVRRTSDGGCGLWIGNGGRDAIVRRRGDEIFDLGGSGAYGGLVGFAERVGEISIGEIERDRDRGGPFTGLLTNALARSQ